MQFLRAGFIHPWSSNQQVRYVGADGNFWSSATTGVARARDLCFNPAAITPSRGDYRASGFSLRCLVLSSAS